MARWRINAKAAGAAIVISSVFLAGCDASRSEVQNGDEAKSDVTPAAPVKTVVLAKSNEFVKLEGVAAVLNPDPLIQLDADIRSAMVAANFSHGQLERFRASTMLSKQMVETAVRQEGIDASQLKLLLTRLQQTWGDRAPFLNAKARQSLIAEIAEGSRALVRLDFPETAKAVPRNVRVFPLRGGTETTVDTLWPAPSGNLAMPGVSYLGLIKAGAGLRTGDRARVIADSPDSAAGVVIPSAALVVYAGQSWCYVEASPQKYERKLVTLDAPVKGGFLATSGFDPGMRVVVKGASILLAREAMPGSFDDDDDGGGESQPPTTNPGRKTEGPSPIAQNRVGPRSDPD